MIGTYGEYRYIETRIDGRVLAVTIDRPEVMNSLNPDAHAELASVFDRYSADPDLWVAVITGRGERAFCTGTDLKHLAATGEKHKPDTGFAGLASRFDLDKPVVAMVNGAALGGGLEIVLACDLAIAVEGVKLGFPEPRVGLAAMGGGIHRLVRQIPHKSAMGLLLTGRTIDASEALSLGILNDVVARENLGERTAEWVESIVECAPLAVQATKAVARDSAACASLADALGREYPQVRRMEESEDAVEGPRAFADKRVPYWRGH